MPLSVYTPPQSLGESNTGKKKIRYIVNNTPVPGLPQSWALPGLYLDADLVDTGSTPYYTEQTVIASEVGLDLVCGWKGAPKEISEVSKED